MDPCDTPDVPYAGCHGGCACLVHCAMYGTRVLDPCTGPVQCMTGHDATALTRVQKWHFWLFNRPLARSFGLADTLSLGP